MQVTRENDVLAIAAETYSLTFPKDRPFVYVADAQNERIAELFVLSSIHPLQDRDDTTSAGTWQVEESTPDCTVFALQTDSSVWDRKVYRFRCYRQRFVYEMTVEGAGTLSEVNFFGGYYSGQIRWGSGFFWSGSRFKQGFNPEPNTEEMNYFHPAGGSVIDLTGVPLPGKGDWFFTPPPFCFAFETAGGWVAMGVEAKPGANRFTEYSYHGQLGFHLSLSYEGHTNVQDRYTLPGIGFDFAADEYAAVEAHVQALKQAGSVQLEKPAQHPSWWHQPIFCGWGSQCYVASLEKGHAPNYAKQSLYEEFMEILDQNDVSPGIVVLDDKWQAAYGENEVDTDKWPDLRGFIDRQHAAGKKVLLWLKAWDPEGIPAEECFRNKAGLPLAFDPSNPAFEKRLRASVRRMLSADGYDADGFKIDFSARIPSGPSIQAYGDVWGLELMKLYLGILYEEAKKVKADALIMSHTPHPYLADVLDMIRLNDINTGKDVNKAMTHRARIAAIACPQAVIDTDNWPITDKETWREYVRLQPQMGVPSLYYVSHIDSTREPLVESDYELVRESWRTHQSNLTGQGQVDNE